MHDIDFHHGMTVADSPSHGAHVFAVNEDGDAERFDDLLNEHGDEVGGAFLILQAARKVAGRCERAWRVRGFFCPECKRW